jgi:hypothetical protein
MKVEIESLEVTGGILAKFLGFTSGRVSQMDREGIVHRTASGKFLLAESVRNYVAWARDETRRSSSSATLSRVQEARAKEIEQRTAERSRQLIPMEEARAMVIDVVGGLRAELDGLPAGITRDLALRKKIEKTLNGIFTRAADRLEKQADAAETDGEPVAAVTKDDA